MLVVKMLDWRSKNDTQLKPAFTAVPTLTTDFPKTSDLQINT